MDDSEKPSKSTQMQSIAEAKKLGDLPANTLISGFHADAFCFSLRSGLIFPSDVTGVCRKGLNAFELENGFSIGGKGVVA